MPSPSGSQDNRFDGPTFDVKDSDHYAGIRSKPVFLAWSPSSPRAEGLSRALGAELVLLSYKFKRKLYAPVKYPLLFAKSISVLARQRPLIIICQEPSPFCTTSALVYHYLLSRESKIIVDAHTADFKPPWSRLRAIHKWILGKAQVVIVTNEGLRQKVMSGYSVRSCIVLPDKIPQFDELQLSSASRDRHAEAEDSSFKVAVVCSFAPDEPIDETIEAARLVREATFYITGDFTQAEKSSRYISDARRNDSNVVFTGHLNRDDYLALLCDVDAVMVLTKRDDTMLSGANEALALSKPLITSSWPALKEFFDRGTLHVDNSPLQIANAVRKAKNLQPQLAREIEELKNIRQKEWRQQFTKFREILRAICPAASLSAGSPAVESATDDSSVDTQAA